MALNFTTPYTFSPNTTIASAEVNSDFSTIANVFTGLEAGTKTLALLKMDAEPATSSEVATKAYVDRYSTLRRPTLQFASTTTVAIESGMDGTSGDIPILFPDGTTRVETSATRTTFNITRNAVLTTSGAQSGLAGATSEATNTWYALYAVKVTDSSTQWVTVGSTVIPVQANYATLNSAYGTSGWVYLGMIRNGDNSGATGDILDFYMSGNLTAFRNVTTGSGRNGTGIRLANSAGAGTLTYTYSSGTGTTQSPGNLQLGAYQGGTTAGTNFTLSDAGGTINYTIIEASAGGTFRVFPLTLFDGFKFAQGGAGPSDIYLAAFVDIVLGVGANPLL